MLYGGNRTSTTDYGYNQRTPEPLNEPTQKLFKAIDDGNLENFKQVLEGDVDVNAFDSGCTPLMTIVTNLSVCSEVEKEYHNMVRLLLLHKDIKINICEQSNNNTVLHLAMCFQQREVLQLLLSHPNIDTDLINKARQSPSEYARQNRAEYLIIEIQKAQKGKQLLNALSNRSVYLVGILLNEELNPNCWERDTKGEIQTSFDLIIKSCLEWTTQDKKAVLTKLLKHKDLDFGQVKPIQAIEQNPQLKQIIKQVITERLTDTINKKDLDDVKKLVEDNCFIDRTIVTTALGNINDPHEPVKNYLNEKFPANGISVDFEEFVQELVDELERTKAQLAEKEKELNSAKQERLSSENRLLRTKSLSNKNEKPSQAISPSRKQSNFASASFVLSGAFAIGACLTIPNLEICIPLAVTAFAFFTIGCYCSYKANTALSDVKSTQLGNVISLE